VSTGSWLTVGAGIAGALLGFWDALLPFFSWLRRTPSKGPAVLKLLVGVVGAGLLAASIWANERALRQATAMAEEERVERRRAAVQSIGCGLLPELAANRGVLSMKAGIANVRPMLLQIRTKGPTELGKDATERFQFFTPRLLRAHRFQTTVFRGRSTELGLLPPPVAERVYWLYARLEDAAALEEQILKEFESLKDVESRMSFISILYDTYDGLQRRTEETGAVLNGICTGKSSIEAGG
jgi:hypothetical protein